MWTFLMFYSMHFIMLCFYPFVMVFKFWTWIHFKLCLNSHSHYIWGRCSWSMPNIRPAEVTPHLEQVQDCVGAWAPSTDSLWIVSGSKPMQRMLMWMLTHHFGIPHGLLIHTYSSIFKFLYLYSFILLKNLPYVWFCGGVCKESECIHMRSVTYLDILCNLH